jgi:Rrf2 family protein
MLTRTTEYAIKFLAALATDQTGQPMTAHGVASTHKIPCSLLQKTLARLVKARILEAAKGRRGGYRFLRPPHKLSLLDIIDSVERNSTHQHMEPWKATNVRLDRRLMEVVQQADDAVRAHLAHVRLSELIG